MIWLFKLCTVFLILINQINLIKSTKIKDLLIRSDYDSDIAPQLNTNKPLDVNVTLYIVNFRALQEKDLTFTIDCFVYLSWNDYRISMSNIAKDELTLPSTNWLNTFYTPSIFFKNGIHGNIHTGQFHTSYFVLRPLNGRNTGVNVFMASRVSIQLLCDFDFKNYPHDINNCDIDLMSLSERTNTIQLNWIEFKISKKVYNPDFGITNPIAKDCSATYSLGTYSCLRGQVLIHRFVRRYFLRKYFPTFLIVMTSFLGFWVPTTSYPARACILTISLLSLITQQIQSQPVRSLSTISYNIWSNACIGLVTLALIEFGAAIVYEEKQKIKKDELKELKKNDDIENNNNNNNNTKKSKFKFYYKYSPNCNLVDAYSRLIFPLSFFVFIIIYFLFVTFRG